MTEEDAKSRYWRRFKRAFRWFRIFVLSVILLLVILGIYFNQVGVPGFVKTTVLARLQDKGVSLEFGRLRFRWFEGLVAESVTIGSATDPNAPRFSVDEARLRLNDDAFWDGDLEVDSLRLMGGNVTLPLIVSNQPMHQFTIENIESELLLHGRDTWELAQLTGDCMGIRFNIAGALTNANYLSQWKRQRDTNQTAQVWQSQLSRVARTIERMEFTSPPELYLTVSGDAKFTNSFAIDLKLEANRALTPWGSVDNLILAAPIRPVSDDTIETEIKLSFDKVANDDAILEATRLNVTVLQGFTNPIPSKIDVDLRTAGVKTHYAKTDAIRVTARSQGTPVPDEPLTTRLTVEIARPNAPLAGRADSFKVMAQARHFLRAEAPLSASVEIESLALESIFGSLGRFGLKGDFERAPEDRPVVADESWAWWAKLEPYRFNWDLEIDRVKTPQFILELERIGMKGRWSAPDVEVSELGIQLYDGDIDLNASLDVDTREAEAGGRIHFTPRHIKHLLGSKGERWLDRFTFNQPPDILVRRASCRLPDWRRIWRTSQDEWKNEVVPQVKVDAHISSVDGGYKNYMFDTAVSDLTLSDAEWHFPNLDIHRPEGRAKVKFTSNALTKYYHWNIDSTVSVKAARPLLEDEKYQKGLDRFEFSQPPWLKGDIWGRWFHRELTGVDLRVELTNATYKAVPADRARGRIQYTNRVLHVTEGKARLDDRSVSADGIMLDFTGDKSRHRVWFTNVVSNVDPGLVVKAIGPKTAKAIEPYRFGSPPDVVLDGSMATRGTSDTDMHFEIAGGPFNWWQVGFDRISGGAHWVTNHLVLSNIVGSAYGGDIAGKADFDFGHEGPGSRFGFHIDVTDADFGPLVKDVFQTTNEMSGVLSGTLTVDSASSGDFASWNGSGTVDLRDGFLWSLPLLGFFSGTMNTIVPGLGKSPIEKGVGTFVMTNSVMHTEDLKLSSPAMRLRYNGLITHKGGIDAKVEAELFRESFPLWQIIGFVATPLTKLTVFRVTGTITEPELKPLYIPRFLMPLFKPGSALKKVFTTDPREPAAKTPPDSGGE